MFEPTGRESIMSDETGAFELEAHLFGEQRGVIGGFSGVRPATKIEVQMWRLDVLLPSWKGGDHSLAS